MENIENLMEFKNEITKDFKDRDKDTIYKFLPTIKIAYEAYADKSLEVLNKYGINLKKSSQLIVLTMDPKALTQTLELASKMGFIEAYKENPKRLTRLVTNVIKRISKCDAAHIPYKKQDGSYEDFLFSEIAFNKKLSNISPDKLEMVEPTPSSNTEESKIDLNQVKDYALRILEQFALTDQKDAIYKRLDEIKNKGLGTKEMLVEAFRVYAGGNLELLSDTIDEVLEQDEKKPLGRVA